MRKILATLIIILFPSIAMAQLDPKLYGNWKSAHIEGDVCVKLIRTVQYEFDQDGYYKIESELDSYGTTTKQKAEGTYSVSEGKITGDVGGQKIGPFKYYFKSEMLLIEQHNPYCLIYLKPA